jgi:hypothetical protein
MTRPPGEDPVPGDFDWALWLGPAPVRPFRNVWRDGDYALTQMNLKDWDPGVKGVYHPFNFRGWWDFGTGALGDMGCHHFNTPFRALKLGAPTHVQASATKVFSESAPLASIVTFEFAARGNFPHLRATWYDGGLKPVQPNAFNGQPWPAEGTLYIGEQGSLLATWEGIKLAPGSVVKRAEQVARTLPRREGTWKEWFAACQGGEQAGCNFTWAEPLTETVLLGNVAIRAGKRLEWHAQRMQFSNGEDANRWLGEPYQNGWTLETI